MEYIVATKIGNQTFSLPMDGTTFINNLRGMERISYLSFCHPIVPQHHLLKGFIKPSQN